MDSVIFQAMAVELNNQLANSRLDKIIQTSAGTLILKLWTGTEKVQLLLKAEGQGAYYLTRESYTAPAKPPRICQLLRARLRRLVAVRSEPLDRIVHFGFVGPGNTRYDLVLEAFGNQGNLVLVDHAGRIVDLLYRREGKRKLLPGEIYQLPEQSERLSLFAGIADVVAAMQSAEDSADHTYKQIAPMSPVLAKAIYAARQAGQSYEAILTRIHDVFRTGEFQALKVNFKGRIGLLPLLMAEQDVSVENFASLSVLVEQALAEACRDTVKDLEARMRTIIKKQYKHLAKRKEMIALDSERQANPDRFKIYGELLLANLHKIKRGDSFVELDDFFQSPPGKVVIEVDSSATPNENAERYFKLYRKAKRSAEHHARRLKETADELAWLEQVELALDEAATGEDLYQVQVELETAGLLKEVKGQLGRRQAVKPEDQLYRSVTPGGWQLYWGKNSRTNDYVSRNMTGPRDFWFHARGMPGAHLVLKCGDSAENVTDADLLFAAALAAGYSKGKDSGKIEVIVAKGRDVKKPKGARPGLVTVDSYSSVIVAPRRLDK